MEFRQNCECRMSGGMAQNYALTTKGLVGCDKITVCMEKMLFGKAEM